MSTATVFIVLGLICAGVGYGLTVAMLACAIRDVRRARDRQAWRQMGGGRW